MNGKDFYAQFEPHDPRIESHVITGTLKRNVEMSDWNPTTRLFVNKHCVEKGSKVRIVMVSRLGDIGITDKMSDTRGYSVRISPDDIYNITVKPSKQKVEA